MIMKHKNYPQVAELKMKKEENRRIRNHFTTSNVKSESSPTKRFKQQNHGSLDVEGEGYSPVDTELDPDVDLSVTSNNDSNAF
jgi:hypothetical protein